MTQTLTTERLKQITDAISAEPHDYESIYDSIKHGEIAAMARELLANREAQPVTATPIYQIWDDAEERIYREAYDEACKSQFRIVYTAPPAPAVPEKIGIQEAKELFNYLMTEEELNATVNGYNACRAAMLAAAPEGGNGA